MKAVYTRFLKKQALFLVFRIPEILNPEIRENTRSKCLRIYDVKLVVSLTCGRDGCGSFAFVAASRETAFLSRKARQYRKGIAKSEPTAITQLGQVPETETPAWY
jgi:hypothetical protein